MAAIIRLGVQVPPADPFWVQMREGIVQQAQQMGLDVVPIDLDAAPHYSPEQEIAALELIQAQELDALISHLFPATLLRRLLGAGLPVIYLNEHPLRHPRFVTTVGLYESAQIGARFLAERVGGRGRVLLVGELESGRSRLEGACAVLAELPQLELIRLQSPWNDEQARAALPGAMRGLAGPLQAIFGFSDGLALAAHDIARALGLADERTLLVGIDGDPLALAAIAEGRMAATVEVSPLDLGREAVQVARRGALGLELPPHCRYQPRLVTPQNIAEVAAKKLIAMAHLPSRLVGVNRHQERQQLAQLEAGQAINRQVTAILDRAELSQAIVGLIRSHYGYDQVYLLRRSADGALAYEQPPAGRPAGPIAGEANGLLGEALRRSEAIYVPDVGRSHRFAPEPGWPDTVSRVVVPIHVGASITGLLDLHAAGPRLHTRQDLTGLQSLADQLGIALRNAELYAEALQARAAAERADTLKTRLLANVSHELRTPLNVILGYTQMILGQPQHYGPELPAALLADVRRVEQSGEHLIRLINDLLDLSRAEIGALDLFRELADPRALLAEAFESMVPRGAGAVRWSLDLPAQLPLLEVDLLRVRQVVLNLLSNAEKFTAAGQITLGARVEPPHLRLWVGDTGSGISPELHEQIFEPFVSGQRRDGRQAGIGLGLSIVRQLVALHGGAMRVESAPGRGSVFHILLPLPRLHSAPAAGAPRPQAMLLVGAADEPLAAICRRQGLLPYQLAPDEQVERLFASVQPLALVCNVDHAGAPDWALIEQIRAHAQGRNLPYLLYSPRDVCADGGAWLTRVLVKPLLSSQLLELVGDMGPADGPGPVLIVDDNPEICAFYQQLVAAALPGAAVRVAYGGAAALALLAHEVPRLLILDLVMPGVDGFAVLQRLRADERTRRVPVLVLSGKVLSAEDVRRLSYHQVLYQTKELLSDDELREQLRRAHAGAPGPAPQTSGLVRRAAAYMQANHQRRLSRQEIADGLGVSQAYLSEIFQQELGLTPWEYLNRYRIAQARELLRAGDRSVTEVAGAVGFSDPSYFGRVFRQIVGCSPQRYRAGG